MNFSFKPDSSSLWPVQASTEGVVFNFRPPAKISIALAKKNTIALHRALLVIAIIILVLLALVSLIQGFSVGEWLFLFRHSAVNLFFWPVALVTCYLAVYVLSGRVVKFSHNVLHWKPAEQTEGVIINVYDFFSTGAKLAWAQAMERAGKNAEKSLSAYTILQGLLTDPMVAVFFGRLAVNTEEVIGLLGQPVVGSAQIEISKIPFLAFAKAQELHNKEVDSLMLLSAIFDALPEQDVFKKFCTKVGLTQEVLEVVATWIFNVHTLAQNLQEFNKLRVFKSDNEINKGLTSVPTPYLDKFSQDLTTLAKHGGLPIAMGRETDLANVFTLLDQGRTAVVIKGAVGTGRSTLVHELAYRMVTEDVPVVLQDKRLVKLELASVVGSQLPPEQVLISALAEAEKSGNIILVLEEVHVLGKAKASDGLSLLEVLVNHVQSSRLPVFATTTLNDYLDYVETVTNFTQIFTTYELQPLAQKDILLSVCVQASLLEGQHKVFFFYAAIEQAVTLSNEYIHDQGQPQKAISLITEAAVRAKATAEPKVVTAELVQTVVSEKTHVPVNTVSQDDAQKLLHLEENLTQAVVGQEQAVKAVAESLRRARSGLVSKNRPIASFLFVGPTGVGKTELARTLARVYFGKEEYMLRLDMSEYQGSDGLEKLLGLSGRDSIDTLFIKHLKNYPFCLFLLDEFEKASREVLNLFLQVLEDGRLTTTGGETLDLTHTMIIATSNAGTADIQAGIRAGETMDAIKTKLFSEILSHNFAPELLNRFDGVILFAPLSQSNIEAVTHLQLQALAAQLANQGITFEYAPAAVTEIANKGYDATLGARPIRRYIQDHVENLLANYILANKPPKGTLVQLDFVNNELILK